jgi:hypothetical protein
LKQADKLAGETDVTTLTCDGTAIVVRTDTQMGVIRATIAAAEEMEPFKVRVEAKRLLVAIDECSEFVVKENVICMRSADGSLTKIVANRS